MLQVLLFNYEVNLSHGYVLALLRGMLSLEEQQKTSQELQKAALRVGWLSRC